jgi:hypothetical protein
MPGCLAKASEVGDHAVADASYYDFRQKNAPHEAGQFTTEEVRGRKWQRGRFPPRFG